MQDNQYLTQLVGTTIYDFIHKSPETYNIIFFYANKEVCENCLDLLEDFKGLAKQMKSDTRKIRSH